MISNFFSDTLFEKKKFFFGKTVIAAMSKKDDSMVGVVVQICGLVNKIELNEKRGFVQKRVSCDPVKYSICIADKTMIIANQNLIKVYCLGIPKEYYSFVENNKMNVLLSVLDQIDSSKFYVFVKSQGQTTTVFIVNISFFEMAFNKMTTEPLLRIYAADTSQNTSNILFSQQCLYPCKNMQNAWFIDLSSDFLLTLVSRFQDELDNSTLRKMNLQDACIL